MKPIFAIGALAGLAAACAACAPDQPAAEREGAATETSAAAAAPDDGRRSRYTRLDRCRLIERSPTDEGDYAALACPGLGGYRLRLIEDDLRQDLVVELPGGGERSLALSEATGSGGFSRLGETVEWRGEGNGEAFRPDAMILRYFVVENAETPERETSYLLTVALGQGRPCVTGKLPPGGEQNERARRLADGDAGCLS